MTALAKGIFIGCLLIMVVGFIFTGCAPGGSTIGEAMNGKAKDITANNSVIIEEVGMIGIQTVFRIYDPKYEVVCYMYGGSGVLSCLQRISR
jgi:hypothetical protein